MEGNVAGLFNATSGIQAANYEYGPFGEPLRVTGVACPEGPTGTTCAVACPFRFGGKYHDDETGLVYYGKRYFITSMGRWVNRDPIEESGGPNLYGFVGNDPVNQQDLLGLIFFDQSSSYWLVYLGRITDPRAFYENIVSGDSFAVASAYSYNVLMAPVHVP
jgi:RHS repeat-associated protein